MGSPNTPHMGCPVIAHAGSPYGPQLDPMDKIEWAQEEQPAWVCYAAELERYLQCV